MSAAVRDVPAQFARIPARVRPSPLLGSTRRYLGARNEGLLPWPEYTSDAANSLGLGEHFQGVQRIGRHLVLSGGIKTGRRRSQLVVIEMGSRTERGPWAVPAYAHDGWSYRKPDPSDRAVHVEDIDPVLWHAGGIQADGPVLAVPVYAEDRSGLGYSEVRFYDFAAGPGPGRPAPLPGATLAPRAFARACGLVRLERRWILATWDDERLELWASRGTDLAGGWYDEPRRLGRGELPRQFFPVDFPPPGTYQSVNLVRDSADGGLWIVAARNTQKLSPTHTGADWLDLHALQWDPARWPDELRPRVRHHASKQMYCYNQQCNFGAAAGVHADSEERLWLYAAAHWLHDGNRRANFNEYARIEAIGEAMGPD